MAEAIEPRDIVWAKLAGFPWWPGFVESAEGGEGLRVVFFGDGSHATLPAGKVRLWHSCPELQRCSARQTRLSHAIAIARECVEESAREQERLAAEQHCEAALERKATLATLKTLETSRHSTVAEEAPSDLIELPPCAQLPTNAQAALERNILSAAELFAAQRDHHARRCVEGGLDRLEEACGAQGLPSAALCGGLTRLWLLCENRENCIAACLLRKGLQRLARLVWARFAGAAESEGEESAPEPEPPAPSAREPPSTTGGWADARQARRVSRKIAKTVSGFALPKPLPKQLCQQFAYRFERLLAARHASAGEYRLAVLEFLESGRREPRAAMQRQCEAFPEIFRELPLRDYFNIQF